MTTEEPIEINLAITKKVFRPQIKPLYYKWSVLYASLLDDDDYEEVNDMEDFELT